MHRRNFLHALGGAGVIASTVRSLRAAEAVGRLSRLRIGQIGTGHAHAAGKIAVLRRSPDFELVGVVEPNDELRRIAEKQRAYQGVRWMTEEALLNTAGLRAVAVETEVKDLLAVGARCVKAGLHVHLDKPAGESLAEFKRLLDEAGRRRLTIQLGYMFRYNPAFEFCFRAAREGWLGRIFSIEAAIGKVSAAAERKRLVAYRGGAMFELGCHLIDAIVAVMGNPERVTPEARTSGNFNDGFADNQLAMLAYPNAIVTVRSSLVEVEGNARRHFVVCGDAGTCEIRPLEPPSLKLALSTPREGFKRGYQEVRVEPRPRYEADFVDLAQVIRGEKEFAWSAAHDLAVQETVLRASGLGAG